MTGHSCKRSGCRFPADCRQARAELVEMQARRRTHKVVIPATETIETAALIGTVAPDLARLTWQEIGDRVWETVIDGMTYRATWYRAFKGGSSRPYWVVRDSLMGLDENTPGAEENDWYCNDWKQVNFSVAKVAAQRRRDFAAARAAVKQ